MPQNKRKETQRFVPNNKKQRINNNETENSRKIDNNEIELLLSDSDNSDNKEIEKNNLSPIEKYQKETEKNDEILQPKQFHEEVEEKLVAAIKSGLKDKLSSDSKNLKDLKAQLKNIRYDKKNVERPDDMSKNNYLYYYSSRLYRDDKMYESQMKRYDIWWGKDSNNKKPDFLESMKTLHKLYYDNSKREQERVIKTDEQINEELKKFLEDII